MLTELDAGSTKSAIHNRGQFCEGGDAEVRDRDRVARLHALLGCFAQVATPIAQTIIDELSLSLPEAQRTIKPVDVGGVAGGTKYKHGGIFFKVISERSIGPSRAKSASRSLRRALLMPQVNPGSLNRCGNRT